MSIVPYAVGAGAIAARQAIGWYAKKGARKAKKAIVKRIKDDAKKPKTMTTLDRKFGLQKAPSPQQQYPARRVTTRSVYSNGNQGGYSQISYYYKRTGKKTDIAKVSTLLQKRNLDVAVMQFYNVPQFSGDIGAYKLSHTLDAGGNHQLPLYLLDLTAIGGAGQPCFWRPYLNSSGHTNWGAQLLKNNIGGNTSVPFLKFATQNYDQGSHHDRIHYGLMDIKLNLYGQVNRPTKFFIQLVQFDSDEYVPVPDDGLSIVTSVSYMANAFWQPRFKSLVGSPIADNNRHPRKGMKILKKAIFNIGPQSGTELDADPHCIVVKWKHYYNKLINMRKYQPVANTATSALDTNQVNVDAATTQLTANYTPFAKDRVYLIVSSTAYTTVNIPGTTEDVTNTASFDINCQTTIRCDD